MTPTHIILFSILLFCHGPSILNAQWQGFEIKQTIPTQSRIYALATGKTNSDQFKDLLALPTGDFTALVIYNGSADGRFSTSSIVRKDANYRVMETGDLDADGIDDLILSAYWNNGFKIFWGRSTGEYIEGQYFGLSGHSKRTKIADMNNDGALDVVALSGGSGQPITLHLFLGDKTRVLMAAGVFSSMLHTDKQITIVDKDNNGLKDVLVTTSFPWFEIFYQESENHFVPRYWRDNLAEIFSTYYYPADFNNDKKLDILANYPEHGFRIHEGLGDTLFAEHYRDVPHSAYPFQVFTSDLNHDGSVDIIMDHHSDELTASDTLFYLLGNSDFTFDEPRYVTFPGNVEYYIVEDFTGDNFPDIIAYCTDKGIVTAVNNGVISGIADRGVALYPNPFKGHITFSGDENSVMIKIFNSNGIQVAEARGEKEVILDTSSFPSGMYVVQLQKGNRITHHKVIKQ